MGNEIDDSIRVCTGISGSEAVTVKAKRLPSLTVCSPGRISLGGVLTSLIVIATVLVLINAGRPLSTTVNLTL